MLLIYLSITTTTPERSTKPRVLVRQIQNMLRQTRCLNDTPNLDRALLLDKFANRKDKIGRELEQRHNVSKLTLITRPRLRCCGT